MAETGTPQETLLTVETHVGLGMRMPDSSVTVHDIAQQIGKSDWLYASERVCVRLRYCKI
jgi:hypothetical protein